MRCNRLDAHSVFDAPINGTCFRVYIQQRIAPVLKAGGIATAVSPAIMANSAKALVSADILARPQPDRASLRQNQALDATSTAPDPRRDLAHHRSNSSSPAGCANCLQKASYAPSTPGPLQEPHSKDVPRRGAVFLLLDRLLRFPMRVMLPVRGTVGTEMLRCASIGAAFFFLASSVLPRGYFAGVLFQLNSRPEQRQ